MEHVIYFFSSSFDVSVIWFTRFVLFKLALFFVLSLFILLLPSNLIFRGCLVLQNCVKWPFRSYFKHSFSLAGQFVSQEACLILPHLTHLILFLVHLFCLFEINLVYLVICSFRVMSKFFHLPVHCFKGSGFQNFFLSKFVSSPFFRFFFLNSLE